MKWTKFTLDTTTQAVDLISDMLSDLGIEGIEIKDNIPITEEERKQLFIDILPELDEDDGTAQISFYLDPDINMEDILEKIRYELNELSQFVDVGTCHIEVSETQDKDWINNWKEFFKPFRIDDTIIIKPTWEELDNATDQDIVIEIDPGTSFGTGAHETTKLCILSLKKYINPNTILLDAGSGSGILSIIAKKLGAKEVLGIDIDSNATASAIDNAHVNNLSQAKDNLTFVTGNVIEDDGIRNQLGKEKYDIVVANILADIIIPLSEVIMENLKPGGLFISSGIINTKEASVKDALMQNQFNIVEVNYMKDWVSFVAKKPE